MKTLSKILIFLFFIGCGQQSQENKKTTITTENEKETKVDYSENELKSKCNCEGLVDWQKDITVKLYENPNGRIIDTLKHDIQRENFLTFTILDSKEDFFKVKIGLAIEGEKKTGWIEKKEYLGTYSRNYSDNDTLFLFTEPNVKSKPAVTINEYSPELLTITDCKGKWAKVRIKTNDEELKGWIDPEMQCSSPYTTCN